VDASALKTGLASCCDGAVGCDLDVVNGDLGGDFGVSDGSNAGSGQTLGVLAGLRLCL
jgi:hypothetical protein